MKNQSIVKNSKLFLVSGRMDSSEDRTDIVEADSKEKAADLFEKFVREHECACHDDDFYITSLVSLDEAIEDRLK